MKPLGFVLSLALSALNAFGQTTIPAADLENAINTHASIEVVDAATMLPQAGAVVNISYPGGEQQGETDRLGWVAFDLPVDASLASIIVSHSLFPQQRIAFVRWNRTSDSATTKVRLRNRGPFPVQVYAWDCTATWVRRSCREAKGAIQAYLPGASTPAVEASLEAGGVRIALPHDLQSSEFVFVSQTGEGHFFPSAPIDWSVDPPAITLVIDGGDK